MSVLRRRRSRARWLVAGLVAVFVALNLAALVLERLAPSPSGPRSSSYATAPSGVAAYADLLRGAGHPVERLRTDPREAELDPSATVVVLDPPSLSRADANALRAVAEAGGTLVVGGARPGRWLSRLVDPAPTWSPRGATRAEPIAPVPEVEGVTTTRAAGGGSWTDPAEGLPILAGEGRTLVALLTPGRGRIALLADTSLLQNQLLASADNAALGLALAGERTRPVTFVESVHGYGKATGLRAIPTSWRIALAGLALAALTMILARGRRLGPPESESRPLPPLRREYVESLARTLARTKRPSEAIEPVREAARRRLAEHGSLGAAPPAKALEEVGARLGLEQDEIRAVLGRDGDAIVAAGRALARLERGGRA